MNQNKEKVLNFNSSRLPVYIIVSVVRDVYDENKGEKHLLREYYERKLSFEASFKEMQDLINNSQANRFLKTRDDRDSEERSTEHSMRSQFTTFFRLDGYTYRKFSVGMNLDRESIDLETYNGDMSRANFEEIYRGPNTKWKLIKSKVRKVFDLQTGLQKENSDAIVKESNVPPS